MDELLIEDSLLESMEVVHHQESEESYADDFLFEDSLLESMEIIGFEERNIDEVVRESAHALLDAEMDLEDILYESGIEPVTEGIGSSLKEWAKNLWEKIVNMWKKFIDWIKNLFRKSDSVESSKSTDNDKKEPSVKKNNEKDSRQEKDKHGHSKQEKDRHNDSKATNKERDLGTEHKKETKSYSVKSEPIDRTKTNPEQKTKQFKSRSDIARGFKFEAPYYMIDSCNDLLKWVSTKTLGLVADVEETYRSYINKGEDKAKMSHVVVSLGWDHERKTIKDIENIKKQGEEPKNIVREVITNDGRIIPLKENMSIQKFLEFQRELENIKNSMIKLAADADNNNKENTIKFFINQMAKCVTRSMQLIVTAVKVNKNSRSKCIGSYKKELNKYEH